MFKNKFVFSSIACLFSLCFFYLNVSADQYQCLSPDVASSAKKAIEKSGFIVEFCSNCSKEEAAIKRINLQNISVKTTDCGSEIYIEGLIVRGVKPPVFDGACTELLEVYAPSMPLQVPYKKNLDLAYVYLWDNEKGEFRTAAEMLGLDTKNICIKAIKLKK